MYSLKIEMINDKDFKLQTSIELDMKKLFINYSRRNDFTLLSNEAIWGASYLNTIKVINEIESSIKSE